MQKKEIIKTNSPESFSIPLLSYIQMLNIMMDEWLPHLTFVETKLLLVLMRKTFGWHKVKDQISLSQLEHLTGVKRQALLKAVKSLTEKELIVKIVVGKNGEQSTFYELFVEPPTTIKKEPQNGSEALTTSNILRKMRKL
jgi:phage replication O-like protein O